MGRTMSTTVKLKIRTPCLGEGRDLEVNSEWTVAQVKNEIQKEWPNHPSPVDQRLIYSGKMLENHCVLKDVLRFEDGWSDHTIHLVCKQTQAPATQAPTQREGLRQRTNRSAAAASPVLEDAPPAHQDTNRGAADQWQNYHSQIMMQQYYAQYLQYMQYIQNPDQWNPNQTHQQQVNHQEMTAAFNSMAAAAAAAAAAVGGPQQLPVAPQQHAPAREPVEPAPADRVVAVAAGDDLGAGAAGNVFMNAGAGAVGAMEEDDDEMDGGRRDIFDWFYVLTRVLVLIFVVHSYSSFARFSLVAGIAIIVYLYRFGVMVVHGDEEENRQPPREQQQPEPQPAQAEPVAGEAEEPTPAIETVQEQQRAWYDLAGTFVTTFFTSMVPNQNERRIF